VARRRARCPESLNAAPANLQVSKEDEGKEQDEEPTKALCLTIGCPGEVPVLSLLRLEQPPPDQLASQSP
jgi:hypothetical protein